MSKSGPIHDYADEVWLEFGTSGYALAFPTAVVEPDGVSYVRIIGPHRDEIGYWDSAEWGEDPRGVIGAILGAATGGRPLYQEEG